MYVCIFRISISVPYSLDLYRGVYPKVNEGLDHPGGPPAPTGPIDWLHQGRHGQRQRLVLLYMVVLVGLSALNHQVPGAFNILVHSSHRGHTYSTE